MGSVREVVADAWEVQRNGYYACGDRNTNADAQPLKFLGKEWDHQHGLDLYDFGARMYDPAVCRWTMMDPLCEKYYGVSIRFLDMESINAVYNALLPGMRLSMEFNRFCALSYRENY